MSGGWLIIIFLMSMLYLFVTIVRFKMNPFFSMLSASILIGLLVKMELGALVQSITSGFGSVMSSLGIVIALGGLLGGVSGRGRGNGFSGKLHARQGGGEEGQPGDEHHRVYYLHSRIFSGRLTSC